MPKLVAIKIQDVGDRWEVTAFSARSKNRKAELRTTVAKDDGEAVRKAVAGVETRWEEELKARRKLNDR